MKEYRHGAHTVFEIHLDVALRVRDLIREICGQHEVTIMQGHVGKEHVHLLRSVSPQVTISCLVQWLKEKTAYKLLGEFSHLRKALWARGHFCCSSGNVTDKGIVEYIANQSRDSLIVRSRKCLCQ